MKMRKTKEPLLLHEVTIESAAAEGKAVAHSEGMVIFVPFVVPGDVVDIAVYKRKKNYAEGRAVALLKPSPLRVEAQCPHFGTCGGCKWQTTNYTAQLQAKEQQVKDTLERLGHVRTDSMRPICGADATFYYRNKLEFTFSTREWRDTPPSDTEDHPRCGALGFHAPTVFDKVIDIRHCALQHTLSNNIRNEVRQYAQQHGLAFYDIRNHSGYLRNLVVRNTEAGEWMVIVVVAEPDTTALFPLLEHLKNQFPQISSLQYIVNTKLNDSYSDLDVVLYYGTSCITEHMEGYDGAPTLSYSINPKSFYQTNSRQARKLYSFVAEMAELRSSDTLYDLYTGTGTIALFLAHMCKTVVGVEYVEEAVADARLNAQLNHIDNATFVAGDMAQVLTDSFVQTHGRPDIVVTDPPRAGMHAKVIEQLLQCSPRKIIYVSCNPATQARDLELLGEHYDVQRLQPVDMFPHTQHVENVAELVLRNQ